MYRVGVDIGGTSINIGVIDDSYNIIKKISTKTSEYDTRNEFCNNLYENICECVKKADVEINEISHIGIGYPGAVDSKNGILLYGNNLNFDKMPLKDLFQEKFSNIKIDVENDANSAAYGEFLAGALKDTQSTIVVTIGTGVGGGIIIDGKIYTGFNYCAGEFGHHTIVAGGKECSCGRKGCFEMYASTTALVENTKEKIIDNKDSILWTIINGDINKINGKTFFDALRKNDNFISTVYDEYIYYLAIGVTNIINIFQPEKLCIGGGISVEGDLLLKPLLKIIDRESYESDKKTIVSCAKLGNDAGIIGAGFLSKQFEQ